MPAGAFVEAYQRRTGTNGRVTRVISAMETGPGTVPGGVGVSAVWVQRFAIITFRACRFVCINSVRQFPLCGVHSPARTSEERILARLAPTFASVLPLLPLVSLDMRPRSERELPPGERHADPTRKWSGMILSWKDLLSRNRLTIRFRRSLYDDFVLN